MASGTWSLFLLVSLAAVLTPGPAMMAILGHALERGGKATMPVVLGNALGAMVLIGASVAWLAAVLAALPWMLGALKAAGVAALLWLGIRSFRSGGELPKSDAAAAQGFSRGALIAVSNPKALLFYSGVLPQFVDPARNAFPQFAIMAATFASLELGVTAGVCWAAELAAPVLRRTAAVRWLHRAGGALMIGAAAAVALSRVRP